MKRDLHKSTEHCDEEKETCNRDIPAVHGRSPHTNKYVKRDLYESKEIYKSIETSMNQNRNATETFLRYMGGHHTPTNTSKVNRKCQKRPI